MYHYYADTLITGKAYIPGNPYFAACMLTEFSIHHNAAQYTVYRLVILEGFNSLVNFIPYLHT